MARILVLDDDTGMRELVGAALERDGHEVEKLPDGQAGLEAFEVAPADLVIMDIVMPRRDGIETIRGLRHMDPNVRILAISGDASGLGPATNLAVARKLGADATLTKPIGAATLRAAVDALLAS
jgi:DNA-binding response OmpR family regulator